MKFINRPCYNLLIASACISMIACQDKSKKPTVELGSNPGVTIEIFDEAASKLVSKNATIEVISTGYTWSEGPVWIPSQQFLIFSDVPKNINYQWKPGAGTKEYLNPSGYMGKTPRGKGAEDGSNGLTLDREGNLLLCQSGDRKVARMKSSVDNPKTEYSTITDNYNGKKYNSPNDLIVDSKSNIYFTDPIYGLPEKEKDPTRELTFEGVYRVSPNGNVELLIDSIERPNGIALSPDEKTLYIASSDAIQPAWFAYQLNDSGKVVSGGKILDAVPIREKADVKQGPDGMKIDQYGNIFSSGPDGINIITPQGKRIGLIKIPGRSVANCAFNEKKDVLYITAADIILKVVLNP